MPAEHDNDRQPVVNPYAPPPTNEPSDQQLSNRAKILSSSIAYWLTWAGASAAFTIAFVILPNMHAVGLLLLLPPAIRFYFLKGRSTDAWSRTLANFFISLAICTGILISSCISFAAICFPAFFALELGNSDRYPSMNFAAFSIGLGYICSLLTYGYLFRQSLKLRR